MSSIKVAIFPLPGGQGLALQGQVRESQAGGPRRPFRDRTRPGEKLGGSIGLWGVLTF